MFSSLNCRSLPGPGSAHGLWNSTGRSGCFRGHVPPEHHKAVSERRFEAEAELSKQEWKCPGRQQAAGRGGPCPGGPPHGPEGGREEALRGEGQ